MTILIVGAMDREIDVIREKMCKTLFSKEEVVNNFTFYFGKLYNKNIILVKSGCGRVNSALLIATAKMKYKFDYCINIGIAGGLPGLMQNDIVIGEKTVYGDVDLSVFESKYVYGQMSMCPPFYSCDKYLLDTIKNNKELNDKVKYGSICSCEKFTVDIEQTRKLIDKNFKDLNILAFDMESACFAQSCYQLNIKFLAILFISDIIGSVDQVDKYVFEEDTIAREERTNNYIIELIKAL